MLHVLYARNLSLPGDSDVISNETVVVRNVINRSENGLKLLDTKGNALATRYSKKSGCLLPSLRYFNFFHFISTDNHSILSTFM